MIVSERERGRRARARVRVREREGEMEREDAEWVPLLTLKIVALCVLNPSDAFFHKFLYFIFEIVFLSDVSSASGR